MERKKMANDGERTNGSTFPAWTVPVVILLGLVALGGLGMAWRASSSAQDVREALTSNIQTVKQTYEKNLDSLQARLTKTEKTSTEFRDDLSVVTKRLQITQGALQKAREEAQQAREAASEELAEMDSHVKDQLATKASADDVKSVSGEVGVVRTDLDSTKKDLQMARSEMGTLIAKNHDDIDTLRRLGERDYVEFSIADKNKPQKVGDVTLELRSADPKKNQCNLAIVVDDKRTEKRNRTVNEPIFFYARGAHQPMEVVINQVEKGKVVGYLSVPKTMQQTATAGGSS
jgi:F0F1-type ATP synthase membrane subunit b/b'